MPSSYSNQIRLELMANGENSNTWGSKANTVFELVEDAIAGMATVAVTGGAYSLTTNNGASDEARNAALKFTGALASNSTVTIPSVAKHYVVWNATTNAFTLSLKTSGGAAVAVAQGDKVVLWCDGTELYALSPSAAIRDSTNKATPVDADRFGFWDSVTGLLNYATWANIKATLQGTITALTNAAGIDIKGTNTNDAAAAGDVGEIVSSTVASGSGVALTSVVAKDVTTISLTAGDWDVFGFVGILPAAATSITSFGGSSSQTTNTLDSVNFVINRYAAFVPGNSELRSAITTTRISLAAPATIYLVALASFTVSTCVAFGSIYARRRR